MEACHLRQLAPIVLGTPIWTMFKNTQLDSWRGLKKQVESRFGLTADQLLDAFYAMR